MCFLSINLQKCEHKRLNQARRLFGVRGMISDSSSSSTCISSLIFLMKLPEDEGKDSMERKEPAGESQTAGRWRRGGRDATLDSARPTCRFLIVLEFSLLNELQMSRNPTRSPDATSFARFKASSSSFSRAKKALIRSSFSRIFL